MLPLVGWGVLALALPASLYGAVAAWAGAWRGDGRWVARGRRGVVAVAALLVVAVAILLAGLLADRFELRYVAKHSARGMPLYLKISALWAGQEGSLLFWAALQAILTAWFAARPSVHSRTLMPWAIALLSVVTTFFLGLCLLVANPFIPLPAPPLDGAGLNPLLRHPAMALHPPVLYVGYVGLAVPAALALAALIVREPWEPARPYRSSPIPRSKPSAWPDAFSRAARPWALGSWVFLGGGLLLGARWAYDVLSWGGYWTWDPVENAGLMPWLTATGLLHALGGLGGRGASRAWGIVLAVASFLLVILGTFIARSGTIASVHAFTGSRVGPPLLAFLVVATLAATALILARVRLLAPSEGAMSDRDADAILSLEGLSSLTLVLLSTLTASILVGTLLPTLTEALGMRRLAAGSEWFDRVTGPQFAGLVLLMGLCPLAGRIVGGARRIGRCTKCGILPALVGSIALPGLVAAVGVGGGLMLAAMALIGAAGGVTLAVMAREVVAWRGHTGALLTADVVRNAARWALAHHRRRYDGYHIGYNAVHVGILIMAVGVVATRHGAYEASLVLPRGERATVQGYELAFEDLVQAAATDHDTTHATVAVYRRGELLARLYPRLDRYPASGQVIATPAVRSTVREDFYLVLIEWADQGATATFHVMVNPLVSLIWWGGGILLAGGALALWPQRVGASHDPQEEELP
jgi:cytochrome c-type biogenesis protein CcmF